jgi:hypothetical protein
VKRFFRKAKRLLKRAHTDCIRFLHTAPTWQIAITLYMIYFSIHAVYAATHVKFLQDQARDVILTERAIERQEFVVAYGPKASVGNFYLPPLFYQIQLLVQLAFPKWPLAIGWLVVIAEAATPVLLYILFKQYLSPTKAVLLSAVYAVSHQVLIYGTHSWNPNLTPLFTTGALLSAVLFQKTKRFRFVYPVVILPLAAVHFHYQSVVLLPFFGLLSVYYLLRLPRHRIHFVAALLVAALPYMPYLLAEITNHYPNTFAILNYFQGEHARTFERVSKPGYVLTYFPAFIERVLFSLNTDSLYLGRLLFFTGMATAVFAAFKNAAIRTILFLLLSIFVSLRLFKGDKLDYYLMTLFILPTFLLSMLFYLNRKIGYVVLSLCLFYVLQNAVHLGKFNHYADLKKSSQDIALLSPTNDVQLVFFDLFYQNFVYYGLTHFTDLSIVPASKTVVDICHPRKAECTWEERLYCHEGAPDSKIVWYAVTPKLNNDYVQRYDKMYGNTMRVVMGTVAEPMLLPAHPYQHNVSLYGTDSLL